MALAEIATHLKSIKIRILGALKERYCKISKKPKKQPDSKLKDVYPSMLDLLQRDTYLKTTEVRHILGLHSIFVACCTTQLWMHELVVGILVLINHTGDEWDDDSDFLHNSVIGATIPTACPYQKISMEIRFHEPPELQTIDYSNYLIIHPRRSRKRQDKIIHKTRTGLKTHKIY
ncbi:hypothetical protein DSO57_1031472 [Entomophthora muscae]|uniref:Uncharacterized protein n=1 Tax=Entomophthora muscae TaxID=34485 RepID=A0ACC2TMP3_9FUNG|nr:hypothetical protein DSO57_1031472 [Entomophthora muscae]